MASLFTTLNLLIIWASAATGLVFYLSLFNWRYRKLAKSSLPAKSADMDYQALQETVGAMDLPANIMGTFKHRVFPKVLKLNADATDARQWNRIIIISSIAIDFLVTLFAAAIGQFNMPWLNFLIIGLSAFQASMKAIHEHFHFKETWITYRLTLEAIKSEIWRFSANVDEYSQKSFIGASKECISQIEAILESASQQVLSRHRQTKQSGQDQASEASNYKAEGVPLGGLPRQAEPKPPDFSRKQK